MCCLALVMLALLLGDGPAQAGWYKVTYSGGTATRVASWGTDTYPYYDGTMWDPNGFYSGGLYVGWGTDRAPDGTTVTTTGQVHCQGTITATFTWHAGVPNYPVPVAEDPPPHAVVIKETSNAFWYSNSNLNAVPNGSSSNGLGSGSQDYESPPGADPFWQNHSSSDTRYQIKQNPGEGFSITCSPSAHISGTGAVGPPEGTGSGVAKVNYRASAEPLEVVLSGGIGQKDSKRYLIGQGVGATLSSGGLTPTLYFWGVSGGEPFKSYSADNYKAFVTPIDFFTSTSSSFGFHFKEPALLATVTCSAHLIVPTGALPADGLDVTASSDCGVSPPTYSTAVDMGFVSITGTPPDLITLVGLEDPGHYSGHSLGITWEAQVTTPAEFASAGPGDWNLVQLSSPDRHRVYHGTNQDFVLNGQTCLDNTYPYVGSFQANGAPQKYGDAPSATLSSASEELDSVDTGGRYNTWLMYLPPGTNSCYVPLKRIDWAWHGTATRSAPHTWELTSSPFDCGFVDGENYPQHPEWSIRLDNSDLENYTPDVP